MLYSWHQLWWKAIITVSIFTSLSILLLRGCCTTTDWTDCCPWTWSMVSPITLLSIIIIRLHLSWCWWQMKEQARSQGGGGEGGLPPAWLKKFQFCPKQKNMPFWCYALNYRPEEFCFASFLCRKTVPEKNFWLQKVVQLVTQGFKQSIQRRRLTTTSRYHM